MNFMNHKDKRLTNEEVFVIQILKDHLLHKKSFMHEKIDWEEMTKISSSHQIDGILFFQCHDIMPNKFKEYYEKAFSATVYINTNLQTEFQLISNRFRKEKIQYVMLKGLKVASLYPIPVLRTMGDLDILVHEEDKSAAANVLTEIGYVEELRTEGYDWHFRKNNQVIELHHSLFYSNCKPYGIMDNCWDYVIDGELDWNYHLIFLIAHLRKHLMDCGVGYRMFLDIAVLISSKTHLNWDWIKKELEDLHLWVFAERCFGLIDYWFDVKPGIHISKLDRSFIIFATKSISHNGVFGYDNYDNKDNPIINRYLNSSGARIIERLRLLKQYALPGYVDMSSTPRYQFVKKRPWLMPAAWVYRFYLLITGHCSDLNNELHRVFISNHAIDERAHELKLWGIDE